ncbi:unnamed protein product [Paramecium primaurelia]|uniref:YscD cytoplasmic domain-containing protein n=1 Tax=Paramecium primaurelia TaxID=5886 RepID=A0A8S1LME5_PARPR|nr:unnamed protein product [Paramecium primaurelia]
MDQELLFWEKFLYNQNEVSWDEFSASFIEFVKIQEEVEMDNDQLLFIKCKIDPDYRNIIRRTDYVIFYETYWKSKKERLNLFQYQFTLQTFQIPKQTLRHLNLKVIYIADGCPTYFKDIQITRTTQNNIPLKQEEIFTVGYKKECDLQIINDRQVNPIHLKIIWTPYNIFLIRDNSRSFRTSQRIHQQLILDAFMIIRLNQNTYFKVKFIQPMPKITTQISTYEDNRNPNITDLVKSLQLYKSVQDYRDKYKQLSYNEDLPILVIEFIEGVLKGKEFLLKSEQEYMLGSGQNCSIVIPDSSLQREHCKILFKNNQWLIQPKESQYLDPTQYGTFALLANEQQYEQYLPSKCHVLHDGMRIVVGPILFQVQYFS